MTSLITLQVVDPESVHGADSEQSEAGAGAVPGHVQGQERTGHSVDLRPAAHQGPVEDSHGQTGVCSAGDGTGQGESSDRRHSSCLLELTTVIHR